MKITITPVLLFITALIIVTLTGCSRTLPDADGSRQQARQSMPMLGQGITWQTNNILVQADDFYIEADGRRYHSKVTPIIVHSSVGTDQGTLEITWFEQQIEMRLNLYFTGDRHSWWVKEIRTYNGQEPGEWIYYFGSFFETPRGQTFNGDVDLASIAEDQPTRNPIPGAIHFKNLRIQCTCPFQQAPNQHMP